MNALRLSDGFQQDLFNARTGLPWLVIQKQIQLAVQQDLISIEHNKVQPTLKGRRFLNNLLDIFL
jgi:coproporphyrinogen III oxidase-like Fe-S oxidoreductase